MIEDYPPSSIYLSGKVGRRESLEGEPIAETGFFRIPLVVVKSIWGDEGDEGSFSVLSDVHSDWDSVRSSFSCRFVEFQVTE